jgi:hypothetical protein
MKINDYLFHALLTIIILFSFFNFSGVFYPYLNSDSALQILMSYDLKLPHDLYCWGQDRLGSLVPLMAYPLVRILHLQPVWAASIVHYLILVMGYFFISTLFKKNTTKLILAFLWFFPPFNFIDLIMMTQPAGIQLSLFAAVIFLVNYMNRHEQVINNVRKYLLLSLIMVLLILSFWISELSIVAIFLFALIALFIYYQPIREGKYIKLLNNNMLKELLFYIVLFWAIAGVLFIIYAKSKATSLYGYPPVPFSSIRNIIDALIQVFTTIAELITFRYESNMFLSLFTYISIILLILWIIIRPSRSNGSSTLLDNRWYYFFLFLGIITFASLISLKWVHINGEARRYFVPVYAPLVIAFLLYTEKGPNIKRQFLYPLLGLWVATAFLSSTFYFYFPERVKPTYRLVSEYRQLGKAGIISEYWNSYVSMIADPENLIATPNDSSLIRNQDYTHRVFEQPRLYVIKDLWFKDFPKSMEQYHHFLRKKGEPFKLGGSTLCEYEMAKYYKIFTHKEIKSKSKLIVEDSSAYSKEVLVADISQNESYFIYGPYIPLEAGMYKVVFHLKVPENVSKNRCANIDVALNAGLTVLTNKFLTPSDFTMAGQYEPFELNFKLDNDTDKIEFRIYYTGSTELWYDYLELVEL